MQVDQYKRRFGASSAGSVGLLANELTVDLRKANTNVFRVFAMKYSILYEFPSDLHIVRVDQRELLYLSIEGTYIMKKSGFLGVSLITFIVFPLRFR